MNIVTQAIKHGLTLSLVALLATGCACRTKKIGGGDNIPVAGDNQGPLKDINFEFDRYDITPASRATLEANAQWLRENSAARVQVEGHCDERGTNEYNMVLGNNRAKAAFDYLRGLGIDASRMGTVSYGEELPLDPRHNEEAWAKNRRAHFNVQK